MEGKREEGWREERGRWGEGEMGRGGEGERGRGGDGEAIIVDDLCIKKQSATIKVLVKTLQNSVPCNNF